MSVSPFCNKKLPKNAYDTVRTNKINLTWESMFNAAKERVVQEGFDPAYGARPLRRARSSEYVNYVNESSAHHVGFGKTSDSNRLIKIRLEES